MAMNLAPSHWLDGYTADSSGITIPLTALPGLSAAEADETTGDIRKVARALLAALHAAYLGEAEADRPQQMELSRYTNIDESTDTTTRSYQARFVVKVGEEEVVDEPEAEG